jgi:hypothetical protein
VRARRSRPEQHEPSADCPPSTSTQSDRQEQDTRARTNAPNLPTAPSPPPSDVPQKNPITVKTLTSAVLFGLGDFMSQKMEGKELDVQRLMRLTAWGGMFAPLAHVWYGMLDKMVPGQGAAVLAKKVAADQVRRRKREGGRPYLRPVCCGPHVPTAVASAALAAAECRGTYPST